jgi:hypothetical protein
VDSQLAKPGVGVEKLFSRDFTNEIRWQVIESSFAAGAEIHTNYCFGSFFNSHRRLRSERVGSEVKADHKTHNNQARDGQPPSASLLRGKEAENTGHTSRGKVN